MPMHLSIRSAPKLRPHSSGPCAETEPDLRQTQSGQPSNLHLRSKPINSIQYFTARAIYRESY